MVVDASVWVSRYVPSDVHHSLARQWLDGQIAAAGEPVAPSLLLAEIAGAISRRTGSADLGEGAAESARQTPGLRLISIDADIAMAAARAAANLGLRGVDAIYVAVAHEFAIPLVTLDEEILDRAAPYVVVRRP